MCKFIRTLIIFINFKINNYINLYLSCINKHITQTYTTLKTNKLVPLYTDYPNPILTWKGMQTRGKTSRVLPLGDREEEQTIQTTRVASTFCFFKRKNEFKQPQYFLLVVFVLVTLSFCLRVKVNIR